METQKEKFIEIKISNFYAMYRQTIFLILLVLILLSIPFIGKYALVALMFIVILVVKIIYGYLYYRLQSIKIFEDRINIRTGVFSISHDYLELYRVKDYEVYQSLFMRIFDLMAFRLHTSDKTTPILHVVGVKKSNIVKIIRNNVERQRKLKGVREFD